MLSSLLDVGPVPPCSQLHSVLIVACFTTGAKVSSLSSPNVYELPSHFVALDITFSVMLKLENPLTFYSFPPWRSLCKYSCRDSSSSLAECFLSCASQGGSSDISSHDEGCVISATSASKFSFRAGTPLVDCLDCHSPVSVFSLVSLCG